MRAIDRFKLSVSSVEKCANRYQEVGCLFQLVLGYEQALQPENTNHDGKFVRYDEQNWL